MAPTLPPELLQDILALALLDEPPASRQQTRLAFGAVCRGWRAAVDEWKQVEVIGHEQLFRLLVQLTVGPAQPGRLIRTLHLELVGRPDARTVKRTQGDLDRILSLVPHIAQLTLEVSKRSLVERALLARQDDQDEDDVEDWFGPAVGPALSGLRELVSFTLVGPAGWQHFPWLSCAWLRR